MTKQRCERTGLIGKLLLAWLLAGFLLATTPAATAAGQDTWTTTPGGVTVFIYHRFGEDRYPTTNIGIERFREQMAYLKTHEYAVISLARLVEMLAAGISLPPKSAVITIDDAYLSVYEQAWPILRDFGYPFTVFVYTKAVDNGHWNYMNWQQVRELQAAGVDMQDHGYAHLRLASQPPTMDDTAYRAWIREDLRRSRDLITRQLGTPPRFFAVPYGEYNQTVIALARELGYEAVLLQDPGAVSEDTDLFAIPREPILGVDWSSMAHFERILARVDLPIADMTPRSVAEGSVPPEFGARLLYPERYEPESLQIYVSELGWQPARMRNQYLSIPNAAALKRRLNRVAVSGREKVSGRTAIRFWLLVQETVTVSQ